LTFSILELASFERARLECLSLKNCKSKSIYFFSTFFSVRRKYYFLFFVFLLLFFLLSFRTVLCCAFKNVQTRERMNRFKSIPQRSAVFNLILCLGFFAAVVLWFSSFGRSTTAGLNLVSCADIDAAYAGFHNFRVSVRLRGYSLTVLPWPRTSKVPWISRVQAFLTHVSSGSDGDSFVIVDALDVLPAPVSASDLLQRFRDSGKDGWFASETLCDTEWCRQDPSPLVQNTNFAYLNGGGMIGSKRGLESMLRCALGEMLAKMTLDDQAAFTMCFRRGSSAASWALDTESRFFGVVSGNAKQVERDWSICEPGETCWWRRRGASGTLQPAFFHFPGMGFKKESNQKFTHCQKFLLEKYNDLGKRHVHDFRPLGRGAIFVGRKNHLLVDAASLHSPCNPQTLARHFVSANDVILLGEMLVSSDEVEVPTGWTLFWSDSVVMSVSFLVLQYDGNLARYAGVPDFPGKVVWNSETFATCQQDQLASFQLHKDGSLWLYCNERRVLAVVKGHDSVRDAKMVLSSRLEVWVSREV
jgi:hypothetical protein